MPVESIRSETRIGKRSCHSSSHRKDRVDFVWINFLDSCRADDGCHCLHGTLTCNHHAGQNVRGSGDATGGSRAQELLAMAHQARAGPGHHGLQQGSRTICGARVEGFRSLMDPAAKCLRAHGESLGLKVSNPLRSIPTPFASSQRFWGWVDF